jgi:tripartite-type tricarboxylate transporter receptor subunit TctC
MATRTKTEPRIIVIAWTVEEPVFDGKAYRADLGARPGMRKETRGRAATWLLRGSPSDVRKAKEYAAAETAKNAGIDVVYVPFAGGGPSGLALLGGHVAYRVAQASEVYPNVRAGKTRALGVGSPVRMPELPDVPTLKELGILFDIPPFGFDLWGPAGMSPAVAQQISAALEQAVKDPGYVEGSRKFVYEPVFTSPAALKDSIRYFDTEIGPRLLAAFPPAKK